MLAALVLAFGGVLTELVRDWMRDANYNHGFLIPVISGFVLWGKREELGSRSPSPSTWGLLGLLLALAMIILGTAGAEVFTQRVGFIGVLSSLVLFIFGWRYLRLTLFPLAFLLLAIPLPYVIYYGLTAPMQAFAAKCAIWGLGLVGVPAVAQGNIIHLPQASLEVAEACSGIRSLYSFLAIGALVAYLAPILWMGRLILFLSALPLSVAGNAVRVWGSGMGAFLIGPEATKGTIHELFGILVFVVSLAVFFLFKKVAGSLWSPAPSSQSSSSGSRDSTPEISG